jgi:hypothetical protein
VRVALNPERSLGAPPRTLKLEGGTPRVRNQVARLDGKHDERRYHYLLNTLKMAALAISRVRELFGVKDPVVVRPLQTRIHVISHENTETSSILKLQLFLFHRSSRFVSDLGPKRNNVAWEGVAVHGLVWRDAARIRC